MKVLGSKGGIDMLMKLDYTLVLKNGKEVRFVKATNNIEIDSKHFAYWDLFNGFWCEYIYQTNEQVQYVKDLSIEKVESEDDIEPLREVIK